MSKAKPKMYFINQEIMLDHQRIRWDRVKEAGVGRIELALIENESAGGGCPHCKVPWKPVRVKNVYADFEYFVPDCNCYGRCERCGQSLHGVTLPNHPERLYVCPGCGYPGEERWVLLCHVCGQSATKHVGKYYKYVCPDCSNQNKKSKKEALKV
jgi:hypothetical protein